MGRLAKHDNIVGIKESGSVKHAINYVPDDIARVYKMAMNGDFDGAQKIQDKVKKLNDTSMSYGVAGTKETVKYLLNIDCGPPRSPLLPLNEEKKQQLHKDLSSILKN